VLWWSKLEMLVGLAGIGAAVVWTSQPDRPMPWASGVLIALGGYLALAGHRSHLYDSMTRQTAATCARSEQERRSSPAERSPGRSCEP
jgi:hypothetical protein